MKFIKLNDGTIINPDKIILLNVDNENGRIVYKLFLEGKKMTLQLTETDYKVINKTLFKTATKKKKKTETQ